MKEIDVLLFGFLGLMALAVVLAIGATKDVDNEMTRVVTCIDTEDGCILTCPYRMSGSYIVLQCKK